MRMSESPVKDLSNPSLGKHGENGINTEYGKMDFLFFPEKTAIPKSYEPDDFFSSLCFPTIMIA